MQSNFYCTRCRATITPDKIKVAGEDYHDVLIDWSDSEDVGLQFLQQLASITGIPLNKIHGCLTEYQDPYEQYRLAVFPVVNEKRQSPSELDDLKLLRDGDCFALSMLFQNREPPFRVNLWLYHRSNFDDDQCTPSYCQHINGRAFLNRRIEIIKYGEPKYGEYYDGDTRSTIRSMGIQPYMDPICSFQFYDRPRHPYYPRTHG
uniref:Uncharacterized protein n=1 Tax=Tetranychus urticae TaxID=32264 RepID=T1K2E2_TETUR